MTPSPKIRRVIAALQALTLAALMAYLAQAGLGIAPSLDAFFQSWVYDGIVVCSALLCLARAALVPAQRRAWLAMGVGLAAWSAGEIHYSLYIEGVELPPYPSLGDYFFLAFYPASYVALLLLVPGGVRRYHASLWLDGMVAGFAIAAVGAAILLEPIISTTGGATAAVVTDLAYPVGDLLLLALVVGAFALAGWRPGRAWALIGAGLGTAAIADGLFVYTNAKGIYAEGSILDALWPAATLLIGWAAWEPVRQTLPGKAPGWRLFLVPSMFALTALGLLIFDHVHPINAPAVTLAAATLAAVIVRMGMTFGENLRMVAESRREALTDALTGLGNRRSLELDLGTAVEDATSDSPRLLVLYDLDGFKRYNDTFGHPAGDALLARLGGKLDAAVHSHGRAYRLGGDEFCALLTVESPGPETAIAATLAALSDEGEGFSIGTSFGTVVLPHQASDAQSALQVADQRLYSDKTSRRNSSANQQARDVLLQVLYEREPDLRQHVTGVAALAVDVARKLGLEGEELDEVARAGELHDIGKMAIPDAILQRPGPLNEVEWRLMHQHTVLGERMLMAAPALAPVARLVRASHECYDGKGYPDGLKGEHIPLGSRIVAVCDAFHAMTSDRPYCQAVSAEEALLELRRCAGTQFDPRVVTAFHEVMADVPADPHDADDLFETNGWTPEWSPAEVVANARPMNRGVTP